MIEGVAVGLGGVAGALSRYVVAGWIETSRLHTLAVNVAGSFALGTLLGAGVGDIALLALATGWCGAFTTFSTFAVETIQLVEAGAYRAAALNGLANLVGSLVAVGGGGVVAGLLV